MSEEHALSEHTRYIEPVDRDSPLLYMTARKAGNVMDELVNGYGYDVNGAFDAIMRSGYDEMWYEDDPRWFSSRFPDEITRKIVAIDGKDHTDCRNEFEFGTWSEHWTAWMLTFVMDATSWKLPYILEAVSGRELEDMYWPYHEMDVSRAITEVISRVKKHYSSDPVS